MLSVKTLSFRQIQDSDLPFLERLYASTRQEELATIVDWSAEMKQAFLQQQFQAQHAFYSTQYKAPDFRLILHEEQPIGRLYLDRRRDEIRIVDISLLPEYRRKGLGEQLLREVMAEAASSGRAVRIHVEIFNPARRLYNRLGFQQINDAGVYHLLEWKAS